jgi:hypothetical protein
LAERPEGEWNPEPDALNTGQRRHDRRIPLVAQPGHLTDGARKASSKEKQMQPQTPSTLDVIYENWRGHQEKLRSCIAPLTDEQLMLQPAARMWPLGQIVQHMI